MAVSSGNVPGLLDNPKAGPGWVSEYQVSGIPFVTSSVLGSAVITKVEFPTVTQSVVVRNETSGSTIAVAFARNGFSNGHYFTLLGQESYADRLRIKDLWLSHSAGVTSTTSVVCGLTTILRSNFPVLTGSNVLNAMGGIG